MHGASSSDSPYDSDISPLSIESRDYRSAGLIPPLNSTETVEKQTITHKELRLLCTSCDRILESILSLSDVIQGHVQLTSLSRLVWNCTRSRILKDTFPITCIRRFWVCATESKLQIMSQRTAERVEELRHRGGESETSSVTSSTRSYGEEDQLIWVSTRSARALVRLVTDTSLLISFHSLIQDV